VAMASKLAKMASKSLILASILKNWQVKLKNRQVNGQKWQVKG
jgi:hypothetical protein